MRDLHLKILLMSPWKKHRNKNDKARGYNVKLSEHIPECCLSLQNIFLFQVQFPTLQVIHFQGMSHNPQLGYKSRDVTEFLSCQELWWNTEFQAPPDPKWIGLDVLRYRDAYRCYAFHTFRVYIKNMHTLQFIFYPKCMVEKTRWYLFGFLKMHA